ncbi:MAG: alpha amylase C-terminal domain-containing protein [Oscillospiraceae bacterium]|nr:alpha amylase C-terminal domain-containing protein [Oscillospiraceae bacterium]
MFKKIFSMIKSCNREITVSSIVAISFIAIISVASAASFVHVGDGPFVMHYYSGDEFPEVGKIREENGDDSIRGFAHDLRERHNHFARAYNQMTNKGKSRLSDIRETNRYKDYGLHKSPDGRHYKFSDWLPNARAVFLVGDFNDWGNSFDREFNKDTVQNQKWKLKKLTDGSFEIFVPVEEIRDGDRFRFQVVFADGSNDWRIPAYCFHTSQEERPTWSIPDYKDGYPKEFEFSGKVDVLEPYRWLNERPKIEEPIIYEVNVGMSARPIPPSNNETDEQKEARERTKNVGTFESLKRDVLPVVVNGGYNAIQLTVAEFPYYGSFGYQVSNFFSPSCRYGSPEQFRDFIDEAHSNGIAIIMDVVYSNAAPNIGEGLSKLDGTDLYFENRLSPWGTPMFDFSRPHVVSFLLSNVAFWEREFNIDGMRVDGIRSILYDGSEARGVDYRSQFGDLNRNSSTFLALFNKLVHEINPGFFSIAEDPTGHTGLASPISKGGIGFDFAFNMGVANFLYCFANEWDKNKLIDVKRLTGEALATKPGEKRINYLACHDQHIQDCDAGSFIYRRAEADGKNHMYDHMGTGDRDRLMNQSIALHKTLRLFTAVIAKGGFLTFMGDDFGQDEWKDPPRPGNGNSYKHACTKFGLPENPRLRYGMLREFDKASNRIIGQKRFLSSNPICHVDESRNVVTIERGDTIVVFNFSGSAYESYGVEASRNEWQVCLSSDQPEYSGDNVPSDGKVNLHRTYTTKRELDGRMRFCLEKLPPYTAVCLERFN